jgi:hypothetical protein
MHLIKNILNLNSVPGILVQYIFSIIRRIITMNDPISLVTGVLALTISAHKSCLTLHTTIHSFKCHPKRVCDLVEELEALISVLESLTEMLSSHTGVNFIALGSPLRQCRNACDEFSQALQRCCSRSGDDRKSFRGWVKLRCMGYNTDDFKDSMAVYKSTITIALTDMHL